MAGESEIDQIKQSIRKETARNPEKFYPVDLLKEKGLIRQKCSKSGKFFWASEITEVCGEPELENGFSFVKN